MTEHFSQAQSNESFPSEPEDLNVLSIDQSPGTLGFIETEEMNELRSGYLAARLSTEPKATREFAERYHLLGQQVVQQYEGEAYTQAQIGLMIALGLLQRDTGAIELFIEDLDDAATYAYNLGYDAIARSLEVVIVDLHNKSR